MLKNLTKKEDTSLTDRVLITYREEDEITGKPTGRFISFSNINFIPLQYSDLVALKPGKSKIPLRFENTTIQKSNYPNIPENKLVDGQLPLETEYSSKTLGLIKGGWLPSGLALKSNTIIIPDRCTVSEIFHHFRNGEKVSQKNDFLDFFADKRIKINPILFALEGNQKRNPSPEVVSQQFNEACVKIKTALPFAEVALAHKNGLDGINRIIEETQPSMNQKQDFLIQIAKTIKHPISSRSHPMVWNEILAAADSYKIPKKSLLVISVLSAISVKNGKSPARRLLKLTHDNYTKELAYNALSDLRSLEILMRLFALFPTMNFMLCTGDKDLALFWAGIRASNFSWENGIFQATFSPIEALLPEISPEQTAAYFKEEND